ncbi:aspartate-semialdehyde dehydrogenase [Desulfurococcaceae archaeon MEX13E-LK6-19]|nr:aspartate-semialdehyde dehydrogenase [Desulfurococcaceae archaeon MEX13E-LK6-19]
MRYRVCVLGATGLVGQRMVSLLARHPWFDPEILMASPESAGKKYRDAVKWVIDEVLPDDIGDMKIVKVDVDIISREKPDLVFSALPSSIAVEVELELVKRGFVVVSNASPMRMDPYVPVLNPEVNADHLEIARLQKSKYGWKGILVKVPNCTTAILTLVLKPIMDNYGLKKVIVSTMQALSGAGYSGVPSVAILDNVIPYIKGEEEKVESETLKILGKFEKDKIQYADIRVSASCHRVMVLDGHLEAVFIETVEKPDLDSLKKVLKEFKENKIKDLNLPTAPKNPIIVRDEPDRPQPRLDRNEGKGMSVVVGRIREDKVFNGVKFVVLGHNTIRGAAGTAILIGELLVSQNYIGVLQ